MFTWSWYPVTYPRQSVHKEKNDHICISRLSPQCKFLMVSVIGGPWWDSYLLRLLFAIRNGSYTTQGSIFLLCPAQTSQSEGSVYLLCRLQDGHLSSQILFSLELQVVITNQVKMPRKLPQGNYFLTHRLRSYKYPKVFKKENKQPWLVLNG